MKEHIDCKNKEGYIEYIRPKIHYKRSTKKYHITICKKEYEGVSFKDVIEKMEEDGWKISSWISELWW